MEASSADVLIVGAGPTGLMNALLLARCGIHNFRIIDRNAGPTVTGHANGVQPRTQEILRSMGLFQSIQKNAGAVVDTAFWGPGGKGKGLQRLGVTAEVTNETPYRTLITQDQGQTEWILEQELEKRGIFVDRQQEFMDFEYTQDKENPVSAYFRDINRGCVEKLRCKFLVGADGVSSLVRQCAGIDMAVHHNEDTWIVADCVAYTDFPDFRRRCVIRTIQGDVMLVPIGDGMIRIYMLLSHADDLRDINHSKVEGNLRSASPKNNRVTLLDILERRMPSVMRPYTFEIDHVEWSESPDIQLSEYAVSQRVTNRFASESLRVLLVGDSGHTHSVYTAQGMNTGMQDATNLAWKLALVIRGRASPGLLETYNIERQHVAHQLVDFEKRFAPLFASPKDDQKQQEQEQSESGKVKSASSTSFLDTWRAAQSFTSGLGHRYPVKWPLLVRRRNSDGSTSTTSASTSNKAGTASNSNTKPAAGINEASPSFSMSYLPPPASLNLTDRIDGPGEPLMPGRRLLPMRLARHVDGRELSSLDTMPLDGGFWLVLFAGSIALETRRAQFSRLYGLLAADSGCLFDTVNGVGSNSDDGNEDVIKRLKDRRMQGSKGGMGKVGARDQGGDSTATVDVRRLINMYVIHTSRRRDLELRPSYEAWKWGFFEDADGVEHRRHGVRPGGDAVACLVRPDHVVAAVYPASDEKYLAARLHEYFDGVMAPSLESPL